MNSRVNSRLIRTSIFVLAAISLFSAWGLANPSFKPVFRPTLSIDRASGSIDIDGSLGEAAWKTAASTDRFVERNPGDNLQPIVRTTVYVTYDNDYLYVGFDCEDNPADVRATMCQRDQYNGDDDVMVLIDTYGDATWAYEFSVNPYGIQNDALWTNIVGEDGGYDLIWHSAARITNAGYQVEMAIPFASLRFPNKDIQTWKMDFWRGHPRQSYRVYSWAANDRNEQCWPCQWGTVSGISNVHAGKGIEILPSVIADQTGSVTDAYDQTIPFDNEDIEGEVSLGGKYAINSDVTFEATVNPDFSQIEADAARIDVNTPVALFFPERRPFFQEGRDIFRTLFNSFYTRTIHDPQFAAKLTGRSGQYRFGFVSAVDENTFYMIPMYEGSRIAEVGRSYVNVLRGMRSIGESSQIGFILNDRRYEEGGSNTVLGLDQRIRLSRNYVIDGQYLVTHTAEPDDTALYSSSTTFDDGKHTFSFDGESFTGYGFISRIARNSRHWNFFVDYNQVGRNYRTETGYDPWVNYRNLSTWQGYTFYSDRGTFQRISPQFYIENRWDFDGEKKWTHYNASINSNLRYAQTFLAIRYGGGDELWDGQRYSDLWSVAVDIHTRPSDKVGGNLSIERGVGVALNVGEKGDELNVNAGLDFKPIDRLVIEPSFEYLKSNSRVDDEKFFENYVLRTRLRLQATKALSIRLVVQYTYREMLQPYWTGTEVAITNMESKVWNVDPLITYRLSPFSVFYIGATYNYDRLPVDAYPFYSPEPNPELSPAWELSSRHFFMKLQYLFQI